MNSHALPTDLGALAVAAGIAVDWRDAHGQSKTVPAEVLIPYLAALGLDAETESARRDSLSRITENTDEPALHIGRTGEALTLRGRAGPFEIKLENSAGIQAGFAESAGDGLVRITLPDAPGYHQLVFDSRCIELAVCPQHAPSIDDIVGKRDARLWGPVAQLYSLRREHRGSPARAHGFGNFTALSELAQGAAAQGAHALAISPVHAMFAANPGAYSPYGPSSRLFINAAYADPAELFGDATVNDALAELGLAHTLLALDDQPLIAWPETNGLRTRVLRQLFDHAYSGPSLPDWHAQFEHFIVEGGEALSRHARFETLHAEHVRMTGCYDGWRGWREQWRDPASVAVEQFARERDADVRFHAFAQWMASRGLATAQCHARTSGMAIGLIADLAVGTDPGGSHAWSRQADILIGLSSGAPPDIYNALGQGWGLTAFSPSELKKNGYTAFIEMLRAVLAHAGGIRIDHVLGLARTWLIPDGNKPSDGAYLAYPLHDMLNLIALEAWRNRAIVIGENLGTVPDGFNDALGAAGLLGMNVLLFERDYDGPIKPAPFVPASNWPRNCLATSSTHDLPTLAGWWAERDIDWKVDLDLLGQGQTEHAMRKERSTDRDAMAQALSTHVTVRAHDAAPVPAMLAWTCEGPQPLALLPLEDILGLVEQPNIPGTIDAHPNWRRRLPVAAETLFTHDQTQTSVAAIHSVRSSL